MQGVRTRRGCISCRRRKRGCDFARPACARCQRLKVACRYEERDYMFVAGGGESTPWSQPASTAPLPALVGPLQSSLTASNVDLQVDAGFWSIYFPEEDPMLDGSIDDVRSAPWIPTVRALAEEDGNLRTAIRAVAYAGLGWMQEDSSFVQHALRLYAEALRETNRSLQDPIEAQTDAVLASCRILSLFEMFRRSPNAPETGQSQVVDWRSHVEGTCRLIQLRGPERHTSENGYNLYDGVRMTAIINGITRRQPNTFTSLSWGLRRPRTLRDELFDVMGPVPDLLHQIDHFSARSSASVESENRNWMIRQGRYLLQRSYGICACLRAWERRALSLCKQESSSRDASKPDVTIDVPRPDMQLTNVCTSHGFGFFFLCTQYWAMCVKIYCASLLLQRQMLTLIEESDSPISYLPDWVDPEPVAQHIADFASYFFRRNAGLWSAQSAIFPISTALFYFMRTGRKDSLVFTKMTDAFADNKSGAIMRDFLHTVMGPK